MRHTPDMFQELKPPRSKPRKLMHVSDASGWGHDQGGAMCRMKCHRCGTETEWLDFDTVTEAKRGIPCIACNGGNK